MINFSINSFNLQDNLTNISFIYKRPCSFKTFNVKNGEVAALKEIKIPNFIFAKFQSEKNERIKKIVQCI